MQHQLFHIEHNWKTAVIWVALGAVIIAFWGFAASDASGSHPDEPEEADQSQITAVSEDTEPITTANGVTLIITEIMYNPKSSEPNWEWIEVYNPGTVDIDLAGFVLDDDDDSPLAASNIASGSVPAGGTAILHHWMASIANFKLAWGDNVNAVTVSNWPQLGNGGDDIRIWASYADYADQYNLLLMVDHVSYGSSSPWPSDKNGYSIYLTDLTAANNVGANWNRSNVGVVSPLGTAYQSTQIGGNTGEDIGSPLEDPTAITLASFAAVQGSDGVTVTWETGTEIDNAGFYLHRAVATEGPFTRININPAIIPAKGSVVSGAVYSYFDVAATDPDQIYYYKLEDIDTSAVSTFHGPVDTASNVSGSPDGVRLYLPLVIK
jgi:hypothetical protein